MRQFKMDRSKVLHPLAIATAVALTLGMTGCHWFGKRNSPYQMSAESRPLEVPPDLDKPDTSGAMQVPEAGTQSVTRSSMAAPAQPSSNASGFNVAGDRDAVFAKVGDALAAVDGLTIASKAQLLGTYDVSYQGSNFLVRVTKVDAGVYVSAVDPRGMPATDAAATQLMASLKTALGGS
jgi:uncharacterized lipoprotein